MTPILPGKPAKSKLSTSEGGTPWQAVVNGLRSSLQDIWQGLPTGEQGRFLRHLRPFFEAHRHRLPTEVHSRLKAEFSEGRAMLLHGSVHRRRSR